MNRRLVFFLALAACGASPADRSLSAIPEARLNALGDVLRFWLEPRAFQSIASSTLTGLERLQQVCPAVTTTADGRTHLEGGCVDSSGAEWVGSADFTSDRATLEGFGSRSTGACPFAEVTTGTVEVSEHAFAVETATEIDRPGASCEAHHESYAVRYRGSVVADLWSGSGVFGNSIAGKVLIDTRDVKIDASRCATDSASGTTTLRASKHLALVEYRGAGPCGRRASISLDGAELL